ncbi:hypothetical protein M0802_000501 [Mischocyttarus mexicanus]|nr:hypothetical protein M0802_000501 [Mischocyttarus mexicanus]
MPDEKSKGGGGNNDDDSKSQPANKGNCKEYYLEKVPIRPTSFLQSWIKSTIRRSLPNPETGRGGGGGGGGCCVPNCRPVFASSPYVPSVPFALA